MKKVLKESLLALIYLKDLGISHGDLKPNNVLYDGYTIKICDFGISSLLKVLDINLDEKN